MRSCYTARGFTLVELLIVVSIIGVLAAASVPVLLRARMTANESSAIGSLRTVNSAELSYASSSAGGFAVLLATLARPCPSSTAAFLSPDLSMDPSVKTGYTISLMAAGSAGAGPNDCNGTATRSAYYATAVPVSDGATAQRGFATTGAGTIFFDPSGIPPTEAQMAPGGGGTAVQ